MFVNSVFFVSFGIFLLIPVKFLISYTSNDLIFLIARTFNSYKIKTVSISKFCFVFLGYWIGVSGVKVGRIQKPYTVEIICELCNLMKICSLYPNFVSSIQKIA